MINGTPNTFAIAIIYAWPLIALAFFIVMPARRAVLTGYVIGWLFLPMLSFRTPFVIWE